MLNAAVSAGFRLCLRGIRLLRSPRYSAPGSSPSIAHRSTVPISGTMIRQDPLRHWSYIPRCVRPYFVKRICLFGPESTGKSTLAQQLGEDFGTVVVPEFARTYLELRHGQIELSDMELIARGQAANEDALALQANRLLFCEYGPADHHHLE